MADIAVVIPCFNSGRFLEDALGMTPTHDTPQRVERKPNCRRMFIAVSRRLGAPAHMHGDRTEV